MTNYTIDILEVMAAWLREKGMRVSDVVVSNCFSGYRLGASVFYRADDHVGRDSVLTVEFTQSELEANTGCVLSDSGLPVLLVDFIRAKLDAALKEGE